MNLWCLGLLVAIGLAAIFGGNPTEACLPLILPALPLPIPVNLNLRQRRIIRAFCVGNTNHDLLFERRDYDTIGNCTIALPGYTKYTPQEIIQKLDTCFSHFPGITMTKEIFFAALLAKQLIDPTLKATVDAVVNSIFDYYDYQPANEQMSIDELRAEWKCLNLDLSNVEESFKALDADGNGQISRAEFLQAGENYFLRDNENDGSNHFFGSLEPLC